MKMTNAASVMAMALALAASAEAQTTKTFVHEQMFLTFSTFQGQNVAGWLFMEDVSLSHSQMRLFLYNTVNGSVLYDCHAVAPDGLNDLQQRDRNIVSVGTFAQQGTADINARPAGIRNHFIAFVNDRCVLPRPSTLTVSCPYQGLPITTAPNHIQFKHTGSSNLGGATTYEMTGHRDHGACTITVDGVPYAGVGTLIRMTDKRVGGNLEPNLFWHDPAGYVGINEVAEQFMP
jgi:hypothetical protein